MPGWRGYVSESSRVEPIVRSGPVGRRARCRATLAVALLLAICAAAAQTPASLDERIERIREVHLTRPWHESQQMIDALRPLPAQATPDQHAQLNLMEARNRLLASEYGAAIERLDAVLSSPVTPSRRARAHQLATNAYWLTDRWEPALSHLVQGLDLLQEIDDPVRRAALQTLAAHVYVEIGETVQALDYAVRGLEAARTGDDQRTVCTAIFALVTVQARAGLETFAIERSEELFEACQLSDDPVLVSSAIGLIGWVYFHAGQPEAARGWLERAVNLHRESGFEGGLVDARLTLGRVLLALGQPQAAIEQLEPQIEALLEAGRWDDVYEAQQALADAHASLGAHDTALAHLEQQREALARLNEDERAKRLAYLQAEFEARRGEQEIRLLDRQNEVMRLAAQAERSRIRMYWIAGGSGALVLALLLALLISFWLDRRRYDRLSDHDGLTGLRNHRSFHQRVEDLLEQDCDRHHPATLVAADVDLFKKINDGHGHQAGDEVLRRLAARLREMFPEPCVLGRIGGEEFGIFLPGHNRLQARQRVAAFRNALGPVAFRDRSIEFTLSFGLAESRGDVSLEALRGSADDALYRAKRAGRNQLIDASDLTRPFA